VLRQVDTAWAGRAGGGIGGWRVDGSEKSPAGPWVFPWRTASWRRR